MKKRPTSWCTEDVEWWWSRQLRQGTRVFRWASKLEAYFSSTVELCDECSHLLLVSHSQILSIFNFSFPPQKDPLALVRKSFYISTRFFIFVGLCSGFSQVPHHLVFFFFSKQLTWDVPLPLITCCRIWNPLPCSFSWSNTIHVKWATPLPVKRATWPCFYIFLFFSSFLFTFSFFLFYSFSFLSFSLFTYYSIYYYLFLFLSIFNLKNISKME